MARARRWWNIFGKLADSLADMVSERIPVESRLRSDAEQMLEGLDRKADVASFAMARADAKLDELRAELDNHEALGRQAEEFLRSAEEQAAERCVALQLQSAKVVARLRAEYETLQRAAEQNAGEFLEKRRAVEEKVALLPRLQEDARMIRAQEKVERAAAQFSLDSAERSFNEAVREVNIRTKQLQNRALLTSDPNAELDRRIRESLEGRQIAGAMAALRKRVGETDVVEAEPAGEDAVASARKMLEAPRYGGLLPAVMGTRAKVTVRQMP